MLLPPLLAALLLSSGDPGTATPRAAWEAWPERRFVTTAAACLRHAELVDRLRALESRHPGRVALEAAGRSVEGRTIHLLTLGRGPRRVMLWSQMHGDEPSATPALLDLANALLESDPGGVLERLTLLIVPMLNPDGAERYARRNAQAIDVNRDALVLATPEGRVLRALRERFQPELGFNLHDQDRRTTVADTGVLATISLLAVAGDPQGTLTPGRARAKRVCALLARTLSAFVPGGVARYDEDWNPRAFGDNLTAWGTPVVLIESGGVPAGWTLADLTRLNYVALLTALQGLARDDLAAEDPAGYEALGRNGERQFVDVLLAGGRLAQPSAPVPYPADVAFDVLTDDPPAAGCGQGGPAPSRIREVGDGRLLSAARRVDAAGLLLVPAFTASLRGPSAGAWLDEAALADIARLGVARLLWHVAAPDAARAAARAAGLAGPGRPSLEVVGDDRAPRLLQLERRPAAAASGSLADALDALTGGTWRRAAAGRALGELLSDLAADPRSPGPPAPLVSPERPASLLLLRPLAGEELDPAQLQLEAVFVDGRGPAAVR